MLQSSYMRACRLQPSSSGRNNEVQLVRGFNACEKYELVSWDDEIPNIWKNKKCSKPPTGTPKAVNHPQLGFMQLDIPLWLEYTGMICTSDPRRTHSEAGHLRTHIPTVFNDKSFRNHNVSFNQHVGCSSLSWWAKTMTPASKSHVYQNELRLLNIHWTTSKPTTIIEHPWTTMKIHENSFNIHHYKPVKRPFDSTPHRFVISEVCGPHSLPCYTTGSPRQHRHDRPGRPSRAVTAYAVKDTPLSSAISPRKIMGI